MAGWMELLWLRYADLRLSSLAHCKTVMCTFLQWMYPEGTGLKVIHILLLGLVRISEEA